jgi:DNA-binding PadR family transcriptional regulator
MSKTRPPKQDKRSKIDLDLFLLACVEQGLGSAYDLKVEAGISPGASLPSLARLKRLGFISPGKIGARGKVIFAATPNGRAFLQGNWYALLEQTVPVEMDSILRVAALGRMMGAKPSEVRDFLKRASDSRLRDSEQRKLEVVQGLALGKQSYQSMRAVVDAARLRAESTALKSLSLKISVKRKRS